MSVLLFLGDRKTCGLLKGSSRFFDIIFWSPAIKVSVLRIGLLLGARLPRVPSLRTVAAKIAVAVVS
jgi:hypothetical protein